MCQSQLGELQRNYSQFTDMGVELVAISVDDLNDATRMADLAGAEFPVLADPKVDATSRYGIYDLLGDRLAAPAVFLIGDDGLVHWIYVGKDTTDRPSTEEVLQQASNLVG
ncbi:MAG: redoxin domain-containing protein [Dehalococcoidia bacterium]|nr:redoxin domain-containing protein [Dehalococcoidia bacterium]